MKYKYLIFVLCCIFFGSTSEIKADKYIDSIQSQIVELEKANLTDTVLNIRYELIKYVENSDYDLFLELTSQNIALAEKEKKNWALIDVYMELGEVFITKGIFGVALNNLNKAMSLAVNDEYKPYVGWINVAIGNAYSGMFNYSKSIEFYKSALKVFTETENVDGIGLAATDLGTSYKLLHDSENAEHYFKLGIEFREKLGNTIELGYCKMYYYEYKISQNQYSQAELDLKNLLNFSENSMEKDTDNFQYQEAMILQAEIITLMADCEKYKGNFTNEFQFLSRAAEIYKKLNDDLHVALIYNNIGNRYFENKKYELALEYADSALLVAKKSVILIEQANSLKLKADASYRLGKFKAASDFYIEQKTIHDSIYNSSVIQAISNVDVLMKTMEKEKNNQIISLKYEQDRKIHLLIIAVAVLFVLMILIYSLFLFRRYKNEQRMGLILIEKNQKISEQSIILEKINGELFLLNKSKDRFHSIIAHDLRSPACSIYSIIELLKDSYDSMTDEQIKVFIKNDYHNADDNLKLLDNLLAWSRIQGGHLDLSKSDFYINEVITEIIGPLKSMAELKNISLELANIEHVNVNADKEMISTVIRNLCTNAVKFTKGGQTIRIGAEKTNEMLEVWVKDQGVGIPKDKLVKLFDIDSEMQRKGTNNESGTGLGLQLCNEFIKLHGGKITVESEEGLGSRFAFNIPF